MISLVFAVALMAAGDTAAGQTAAQTAAPAAAQAAADKTAKPNKDGLICKKEPVLGSRMKSRICMTQAQWDQRQADDREMIEKAQSLKPLEGN